jgi:site-specific DNA-methyltransferase (adenine-specific)
MKTTKINFYNIDCIEFMKSKPDGYYDLAIVDPPYGIRQPKQGNLKGYNGRKSLEERLRKNRLNTGAGKLKDRKLNTSNCEWDNEIPSDEYFQELKRVSKNQIIWGGNYFPLPPSRCIICWDKIQPWENFSQVELAWTSFDSPAQLYRYDNRTGNKIHSTQKPIDLYRWILQKYAKESDKILDTHGGSMSIAIACDMEGFDLDICEIDKDYFESAKKRFDSHKAQLPINFDF